MISFCLSTQWSLLHLSCLSWPLVCFQKTGTEKLKRLGSELLIRTVDPNKQRLQFSLWLAIKLTRSGLNKFSNFEQQRHIGKPTWPSKSRKQYMTSPMNANAGDIMVRVVTKEATLCQ